MSIQPVRSDCLPSAGLAESTVESVSVVAQPIFAAVLQPRPSRGMKGAHSPEPDDRLNKEPLNNSLIESSATIFDSVSFSTRLTSKWLALVSEFSRIKNSDEICQTVVNHGFPRERRSV